ncbi:MAG: ABC transporter permease [Anaerolineae bacterium]
MSRVWTVARHEYLVGVRRPGFIILTAMVPLLGLAALAIAALAGGQLAGFFADQLSGGDQPIGVVDGAGFLDPLLPEYEEQFQLHAGEEAGIAALREEEISALLIVPSEYLADGKVRIVSAATSIMALEIGESDTVRGFLVDHLLRDQLNPELRNRAAHPIDPVAVALAGPGGEPAGEGPLAFVGTFLVPFAMAILLVVTVFVSSGYLLQGVAEEKESRVIEIVLSSVSARELLGGKLVGLGALGLTQILIWLVAFWALSGSAGSLLALAIPLAARPGALLLAVVYYLLGFSLYAALMGAAGSLGTTQRESQQLAGIFSVVAAVPLMVSGFLFTNPDALLGRVLSWFPLTAPAMMMLRLPLSEVPAIDVAVSLLLLSASVPAALWLGAKVFRMGLLMYGKRPGFVQVWRALREA